MPDSNARRQQIEVLIQRSERLEDGISPWQLDDPPSPEDIRRAQRDYASWYAECLRIIPDEDRARFVDLYEGGTFTSRIRTFLSDPVGVNPFFNELQPTPLIDRWQNPFERTFRDNLVVQRGVLFRALHLVADPSAVLDELTGIFRRLPDYLSVLRHAENPRVAPPEIRHEADLQVVVHGILRLLFEDVRPEDSVPQQAGGGSRVDFLLRDAGVVVETKMTRQRLNDRAVGEELLVDWGRYPRHPDCRAIFALVYDPDRRIQNAAALEQDLSQDHQMPVTRVLVVR